MVMNKNKQTNKGNTMIKEKAIDIELSEIVKECEVPCTHVFEDMKQIEKKFAIKTFKNGKIKFKYLNSKNTYFYGDIIKDSGGGYEIILDFYCKDLPSHCTRVIKNCEDFKIYNLNDQWGDKIEKFDDTQLFKYFDGIIEHYDYVRFDDDGKLRDKNSV